MLPPELPGLFRTGEIVITPTRARMVVGVQYATPEISGNYDKPPELRDTECYPIDAEHPDELSTWMGSTEDVEQLTGTGELFDTNNFGRSFVGYVLEIYFQGQDVVDGDLARNADKLLKLQAQLDRFRVQVIADKVARGEQVTEEEAAINTERLHAIGEAMAAKSTDTYHEFKLRLQAEKDTQRQVAVDQIVSAPDAEDQIRALRDRLVQGV